MTEKYVVRALKDDGDDLIFITKGQLYPYYGKIVRGPTRIYVQVLVNGQVLPFKEHLFGPKLLASLAENPTYGRF